MQKLFRKKGKKKKSWEKNGQVSKISKTMGTQMPTWKKEKEMNMIGPVYNTTVLSFAFGIYISWAQASSKPSWTWAYEISSHSIHCHMKCWFIYMLMLAIMYDQCKKWFKGHENTLDTSRMINGTTFVFMT